MTLIQSPLFDKIKKYLTQANSEKQIFLFVPFIKVSILEKLIEGIENKIIIITDWSKRNLIAGSAELKLYPFCQGRKIPLYHNKKLHLKVYSVNLEDMILATGNISHRGLMPDGNLELGMFIEQISIKDRLFLEQIRRNSTLINDELYEKLESWSKDNPPNPPKDEEFPEIEKDITKDQFLISALPMTIEVKILQKSYDRLNQDKSASDDKEINGCVYHDLANYDIPLGLSPDEFRNMLKKKFFEHPFIQKIDEFIDPEAYFGRIKEWVQDNCTDVPVPSRRELTGNVKVLYDWFEKLGDGKYIVDRPDHSQRIRKITTAVPFNYQNQQEYDKEVLEILASPGHTINEIQERYTTLGHRDIHENPSDLSELENKSKPIWHYKTELNEKIESIVSNYTVLDDSVKEKISKNIAYRIGILEKSNIIVFWFHRPEPYSDGIWRLTEKGKQET